MTLPAPGQPAPDFTLPRNGGGTVTLSALRPRRVVLYFYPRDDTPGCTTEALDFTALLPDFHAAGAEVVGISTDSAASHDRFCARHGLGIVLAADETARTCEDYGVWGEKSMYGKTFTGVTRTTFAIDGRGIVARVWPRVAVKGHAAEVLEAIRALPA